MSNILVAESTLTERYQTTVPEPVRKVLHLHKREKIRYTVTEDGNVILSRIRKDGDDEDSVLFNFLTFLANDLAKNPSHIQAIDNELVTKISSLVSGVDINLDEPLSDEEED